ncbi:hypothetical protein LG296_20370 (plasmid) [Ureibacillus chungkukjangi]|uniref:hypothetical protein n=1 Tax=Ureibacillus chungkukjangi TaxID=1202712 RepID=UPI000D356A93|nr:hypothetical protein [Ureibacillus chungkukjangi]MCM3389353.1 hypothetical protein [Ureibacillus chungkukjangi]MDI7743476.1 hypothetical protein [Lysinibacillus fusiformis]HCG4536108.1 hypothetical protein [Salmonella enterica subsp. enterica serovar Typhi str. AG3]
MKKLDFINVIFMLCALAGCSNSIESKTEQTDVLSGNERSQEVNLNQEKPPSLTITFGEKVIKTRQGGYSWSYLDSKTGQMVGIEADSMPSTELVKVKDAVSVNISEPISLKSEKKPLNYEIRVYNHNAEMIATYNDFKDINEKGKAIYEILATWEEGKGIYAVALDIQ